MSIIKRVGTGFFIVSAFFVYFTSESLLRQAAVSNIDNSTVSVESVVAKLPDSMRERVNYHLEMGYLRDAVIKAPTEKDRVSALLNLADRSNDFDERTKIYWEVLCKYPKMEESLRAYLFFLLNEDKAKSIGIPQYHAYIQSFPQLEQFLGWQAGYHKLQRMNSSPQETLKYLEPLVSLKPEYRDYAALYKEINTLSHRLEIPDLRDKSSLLETECLNLPTIAKILQERQKQQETLSNQQKQK